MLARSVCVHCHGGYINPGVITEYEILCPVKYSKRSIMNNIVGWAKRNAPPPTFCLYKLEHAVAEGMKDVE